MHFIARFEPLPGREAEFRDRLIRVVAISRAEAGCLAMNIFESTRDPTILIIHSEWTDEAAFERHAQMPHTIEFVAAAESLLSHPIKGLRLAEISVP